jgi:hypothetical protein
MDGNIGTATTIAKAITSVRQVGNLEKRVIALEPRKGWSRLLPDWGPGRRCNCTGGGLQGETDQEFSPKVTNGHPGSSAS